jgi:hypothetical protein
MNARFLRDQKDQREMLILIAKQGHKNDSHTYSDLASCKSINNSVFSSKTHVNDTDIYILRSCGVARIFLLRRGSHIQKGWKTLSRECNNFIMCQ